MIELLPQILGSSHPTDSTLYSARPEVLQEIESCYAVLVDTDVAGSLSAVERGCVSLRVAAVHRNSALTAWFTEVLEELDVDAEVIAACAGDATVTRAEVGHRLALLVNYSTQQALEPALVGEFRVRDIAEHFTSQEVVTVSELVAFVSYLVRMVAGLQLLRALEES